jgi:hypothetical protein
LHTDKAIHQNNKIHDNIKRYFGKRMIPSTKLRLYNITAKAAPKYGSEVGVLSHKERQHMEIAQMKFLIPLLALTKLDHQRHTTIREKLKVEHIVDAI